MTALSDALATAATAASGKAAAQTAAAAATPAGSTPTALAVHIAAIIAAGTAIRAAGGNHIQAGLKDSNGDPITANNGWVGRSNPNGVHGNEGVCGFTLAGVDDVSWVYELHRQTNDTPNYTL